MRARIRARDVMLALDRPEADQRAQRPAGDGPRGHRGARRGRTPSSSSTPAATGCSRGSPGATVAALGLAPGVPLWAVVKAVTFDRGNAPGRTRWDPGLGPCAAGPAARS